MFKKFEEKENISGVTQLKSSVQKGIRNSILDTYPDIAQYIDNFLPKKDQFKVIKCLESRYPKLNLAFKLVNW